MKEDNCSYISVRLRGRRDGERTVGTGQSPQEKRQ